MKNKPVVIIIFISILAVISCYKLFTHTNTDEHRTYTHSDKKNKATKNLANKPDKSIFRNKEALKVEIKKTEIENKIISSLEENNIDNFDSFFSSLLNNNALNRQERIKLLWNIARKAKSDYLFGYTLDTLSNLSPIELTPEIIKLYNDSPKQRKIKLLYLLGDSLLLDSIDNYSKKQLDELGKKFYEGTNFLKNELYQTNDQELFDSLFTNYSKVANPKDVINAINQLFTSTRDTKISQQALNNNVLTLIFEDKDLQNNLLPQLIAENQKNSSFNNTLSVLASELDSDDLIPSAKNMLIERISNNLKSLSTDELKLNDKQNALVSNLEAIAKLEHEDKGISIERFEVDLAINFFFLNSPRPMALATSIVLSDNNALKEYQIRKDEILPFLQDRLTKSISNEEKRMILEAVRILKEESSLE